MWIITKDLIPEKGPHGELKTRVGVCSMDFTIARMKEMQRKKKWFQFRLKDGDDNIYYEGFSDSNDDESAFGPLDDFGYPDAGCSTIEYKEHGRWEPL